MNCMRTEIDLTRQRFGKLIVIERLQIDKARHWKCICDCGGEKIASSGYLNQVKIPSCGCTLQGEDHTGKKFGKLTVMEKMFKKNRQWYWKCQCDCGKESTVLIKSLISGNTQSCGCLNREASTTHGLSYLRIFHIWKEMINRCGKEKRYKLISVCDEWRNSFDVFYQWAIKMGYNDTLEIDRKDNDKNYCPENCRWGNSRQTCMNRRKMLKKCTSKYKGVSFAKNVNKWVASIRVDKKFVYLGLFVNEISAAEAYDRAAKFYFKEFACPNFK